MDSLYHKERLIKPSSDRSERKEDNAAKHGQGRDTRSFFLRTENGKAKLDVVADPEAAMDSGSEEHDTSRHAMEKVEFLITVAGSEEE